MRISTAGRMTDREVAGALGIGNAIRYAATTGTVAIRWEGARAPAVWTVAASDIDPADACRELARRYLHIFGPTTAQRFARWAGISRRAGAAAFAALEGSLVAVGSPLGDEWLLADDEPTMRAGEANDAPARLLPSGDAYFLLDRAERELLVPAAEQRGQLWTSRVWPGALLVDGEIRGTWRRANEIVRIERLDEAHAGGARGGRGGGAQPAAPRPRAGDRRRLGDVTDANICSIVSSWPSSTARSRAARR